MCRVCGWEGDEFWQGSVPLYVICPCCGSESGIDDDPIEHALEMRRKWLASGAKWAYPEERPEGWVLAEQLARLGAEEW